MKKSRIYVRYATISVMEISRLTLLINDLYSALLDGILNVKDSSISESLKALAGKPWEVEKLFKVGRFETGHSFVLTVNLEEPSGTNGHLGVIFARYTQVIFESFFEQLRELAQEKNPPRERDLHPQFEPHEDPLWTTDEKQNSKSYSLRLDGDFRLMSDEADDETAMQTGANALGKKAKTLWQYRPSGETLLDFELEYITANKLQQALKSHGDLPPLSTLDQVATLIYRLWELQTEERFLEIRLNDRVLFKY